MARGGNYANTRGLSRKKYLRGHRIRNWPPPGRLLEFPECADAKKAPKKGNPLGLTLFEGIGTDIFHVPDLSVQEIKASTPKKCSVGLQGTNEQFIAQFEQKSAQIFM